MKKILFLLILVLLATPCFGDLPTKYENYETIIKLSENRVVEETITIQFPEKADKFNIYLIHRARNLEIFAGEQKLNCESNYERAGTLISCEKFNSSEIQLSFEYYGLITPYTDYYIYSDRYFITTPTDNFNLKVYLPRGYILSEDAENGQPSYYPSGGVQKTDGKNIYLEWNFDPKLGEVYDVSVFYEKALREDQFLVIVITSAVIIGMFSLFVYFRRKPRIVDVGLKEDERKVLNVVTSGGKISQKKIARETGFSKAHVSRIAKSLESRGLIERRRRGRNYEIVAK